MVEINFLELKYPDKFSALMNQLLDLKFRAIAIKPPHDRGRDSYEVSDNKEIKIYQYKYFTSSMNSTQKRDVKESLNTALKNYPSLKEWILCIPREISSSEEDFLRYLFLCLL